MMEIPLISLKYSQYFNLPKNNTKHIFRFLSHPFSRLHWANKQSQKCFSISSPLYRNCVYVFRFCERETEYSKRKIVQVNYPVGLWFFCFVSLIICTHINIRFDLIIIKKQKHKIQIINCSSLSFFEKPFFLSTMNAFKLEFVKNIGNGYKESEK